MIHLGHGLVMIALYSGFLYGSVQALNLAVGPGMCGLGKAVFDNVLLANTAKNVLTVLGLVRHVAKRRTVVSQHFMNGIR